MTEPAYAELHAHSWYSLLDGASAPEALVAQAQALGLHALALTDHNSLAGAVRFQVAAQREGLHAIFGAEITLAPLRDSDPASHLTFLAETQAGYANLCRLISASRLDHLPAPPESFDPAATSSTWPGKIAPLLTWERLAQHTTGLIVLTGCRRGPLSAPLLARRPEQAAAAARRLRDLFGPDQLFVELQMLGSPDDNLLNRRLCALARTLSLPVVATGNIHYATPQDAPLRAALLAIDANLSLTAARRAGLLPSAATAALAPAHGMAARFSARPDALAATLVIADRCQVTLDFAQRRLPAFRDPATDKPLANEFAYLYELCHAALPTRYPDLRPAVLTQLAHELDVIAQAHLAGFFLIVWDIVRFARAQGIRCQGRGSAAGSIVAYLLAISSVDPLQHNLLFERFLAADRHTMPDIDLDIAADRREEVIQYVYARYGRAHAAMVCNAVTYRARSALRDLGQALEIPEAVLERLAGQLETDSPYKAAAGIEALVPESECAANHPLLLLADLMRRIEGAPRHLSIHSGGMLITALPLDSIVPLEPATMPGRVIAQWDKDSVEDAGLIKIDLLGLRTLGLIAEAQRHAEAIVGAPLPDLNALPFDDPALYALMHQGDTIGTFQVESRAQVQMSVRMLPRSFEEIAVEIAIVRPGPIQGGAVHPYLRRRAGQEPVTYLHPSLEPVLRDTLGVLLYQEQSIRVAVAAAGFTPGEADLLRRAMSRSRSEEAMAAVRVRFMAGAQRQGIDEITAAAIFNQLAGFAGFGFCKSHATSFALITWQTLWLKHYHPVAFYCALFNQQPMGFYSPEVIAGDARRHGVTILPPDVTLSGWCYHPERQPAERQPAERWALRMGLATVAGLGEAAWQQIEAAHTAAPFAGLADFARRTRLDRDTLATLIRAGACDLWGERRALLWALGELETRLDALTLVHTPLAADLPALPPLEQSGWEHELLGLAPGGQLMQHYRAALRAAHICATWEVKQMEPGRCVRVAGLMAVRQRPPTAKGILFVSLEDESGLLDLVVKPEVYTRLRDVLRGELLIVAEGVIQRNGRAVSVLVHDAAPLMKQEGRNTFAAAVGPPGVLE